MARLARWRTGEVPETAERGVVEGQTQKILNGMPMLYTVPHNSLGSVGVAMES